MEIRSGHMAGKNIEKIYMHSLGIYPMGEKCPGKCVKYFNFKSNRNAILITKSGPACNLHGQLLAKSSLPPEKWPKIFDNLFIPPFTAPLCHFPLSNSSFSVSVSVSVSFAVFGFRDFRLNRVCPLPK